MDFFVVLLLLFGMAAVVYMIVESRGGVDTATTTCGSQEIINLALSIIPGSTMSRRSSWMPTGSTSSSAGFIYNRRASILVAFALLLFFVIPSILYLVFGGKSQSLQINVLVGADGQNTVQVSSSGAVARRRGRHLLRGLPQTRGTIPATQQGGAQASQQARRLERPS